MKTPVSPELIALAHRLADASGEVIRKYFRSSFHIDAKADDSPVTIADREAEKAIRAILEKERPHDGVHGEEFGSDKGSSGLMWILDPVDGTKAFATGRPLFGTLIGLVADGNTALGVLDQPINRERWIGATGHGTTFNGKPCRIRDCDDLSHATFSVTGADRHYENLRAKSSFFIYGGDCYSYGQLASGWLDGVVEEVMKLHDFAPLIPIVEGAGGKLTDWQGKPLPLEPTWDSFRTLASGHPALHDRIVDLLPR